MHLKLKSVINKIIHGDVLDRLRELPDGIVQTVITSPPYWGLRDYGTAEWEGGDLGCDHIEARGGCDKASKKQTTNVGSQDIQYRDNCLKCGAIRVDNQLGLEATPEEYVAKMVEIFAEVRRVLRDDGTLWLNLGDSYASQAGGQVEQTVRGNKDIVNAGQLGAKGSGTSRKPPPGLKPKDLCGMPWRVAFALQGDGWWLRSDIIWSKSNPMPESITDRPTKAHEYLFLFAKSGTTQYWTHRSKPGSREKPVPDYRWIHKKTKLEIDYAPFSEAIIKAFWSRINLWRGHDYYYDADAIRETYQPSSVDRRKYPDHDTDNRLQQHQPIGRDYNTPAHIYDCNPSGRNRRTVWEIPTQPYPEAHFATFPEKLVEPCILAGSNDRACGICGAAWERITEKKRLSRPELDPDDPRYRPNRYDGAHGEFKGEMGADCGYTESTTLGFRPSCKHDNGNSRSIVLDPFGGAGTTPLVALTNGRDHITIELKYEYIQMIKKRLKPLGNRPLPQQEKLL